MYDKQTMEEQLIEENKKRFNQAAHSLFLCSLLVNLVGQFREAGGVQQIFEGTVGSTQTEGTDRFTQLLIKQMVKPSNFAPLVMDDDVDSFVRGWEKTREHTASGRSALHFGHFIAACSHSQLKHIKHWQASFPLSTGYSPKRWQQGIEVMLLKQPNNYHVNKLRAILLFEADFNHNNKRIG
jgi:hypothetical protein